MQISHTLIIFFDCDIKNTCLYFTLDEIDSILSGQMDTYPFSSEGFAHLYLLLHSSRPLVGCLYMCAFNIVIYRVQVIWSLYATFFREKIHIHLH